MSLIQFFRILWARRWIVIAATAACFGAALLASQLLPTRYEAKSRVMLELLKPDPVTGQVLANNFSRTYTATQMELIRDYRISGAVADRLGWTASPELLAQFNAANPGGGDFRRWLAQLVADNTRVQPVVGSNILEISYTGNSPEASSAVADAIRDVYVEQTLATKRETASGSADWFDGQVGKMRDQLAAAERRLTNYQRANNVVLNDDSSDLETNRLRALASAAESTAAVAPSYTAGTTTSPGQLQLAALDSAITAEGQALGPNHPRIKEMRRQREVLAQAVSRERAPTLSGGGAAGPSLNARVAKQTALVIGQRDKIEEARRLQADVNVLRDQYIRAQQRSADLRLQADSNDSGVTLLGSAVTPESPSFPNMPLILFGSLAAGVALGVLAALITEMLSRRVRGVEDLRSTGVPVIGVLHGWTPPASKPSLLSRLKRAASFGRSRAEAVPA